jgi:hypothetical protein
MNTMLMRRLGRLGIAFTATAVIGTPRLLRLGAIRDETRRAMPGDDEVPHAQVQGTRAITIDRATEAVWPWIAQIGYDRAGWYAFDRADNDVVESRWEIVPEMQHPEAGQVIGEEGSTIRAIEPNRLLLLSYHWPKMLRGIKRRAESSATAQMDAAPQTEEVSDADQRRSHIRAEG